MKIEFLVAKITDIGLLMVYYFIVGFLISVGIDQLLGEFRPTNISKCSFAADRFTFQAKICGAKPRKLPL
jgi:hypothetical protein